MLYRLKCLTLVTLVLSLTYSVGLSAKGVVAQHTLAQAATSNNKAEADKLYQQGVQQYRQGYFPKALKTYLEALAIYRQLNDKPGIGQTLNDMGEVYNSLEKYDQAQEVLQQALTIRRELKDRKGEGETFDNIGSVYFYQYKSDKALEIFQQALVIRREVKDRAGEGKTLRKIGGNYLDLKQYPQALKALQQALAINREVNDRFQEGWTLLTIGRVYLFGKEEYTTAREWLEKALAVNRELGNRYLESASLSLIGFIYNFQGKYDTALEYQEQALKIVRQLENRKKEAVILQFIANNYNNRDNRGDKARGLELYQQALGISKELNDPPGQLSILINIIQAHGINAQLAELEGYSVRQKQEASLIIPLAQEALPLAKALKDKVTEALVLENLGNAYFLLGDDQKAIESAQDAIAIAREIPHLEREYRSLGTLGRVYSRQGNYTKEIELDRRQLQIAQQLENTSDEVQALVSLGSSYNTVGEYEKAIESFQQALTKFEAIQLDKIDATLRPFITTSKLDALLGLSSAYYVLGQVDKAIEFAQQRLKEARQLENPKLEAEALISLGYSYANVQELQKAIELMQQGLAIAKQINNPSVVAEALQQLSRAYTKQGNHAKAIEFAQQDLTIAQQIQNPSIEAQALYALEDIYKAQGNYQKAFLLAQQQVKILRQAKLQKFELLALIKLGNIYINLGDSQKAIELGNQSLNLARQLKNPQWEASALNVLSLTYNLRGEWQQAIDAAQASLAIARKSKYFIAEAEAASSLSHAYVALGETNKVIELAEPALVFARKSKERIMEANLLMDLGNAYSIIGNYSKGIEFIQQALTIARQLKNRPLEAKALAYLGNAYTNLNDYQKATELLQQSLQISQEIKSPSLLYLVQSNLGRVYQNLGDYNKSNKFYQQVLATTRQLKNRPAEGFVLVSLASNYFTLGEPQKTVDFAQQGLAILRESKKPAWEVSPLLVLSLGYGELGNDQKALQAVQTSLAFARKVQNPALEKTALNLLGSLHRKFGRKQDAIAAYQTALAIKTDTQVLGGNSGINAGLAIAYRDLNQPLVAITYYKQAINGIEQVRRNLEGLPPQLQNSFLQATYDFDSLKVSDIYRQLADLLLSQRREAEAQQVLELLKLQELNDFTSRTRGAKKIATVRLSDSEQKIATQNETLIAFGKQLAECEAKNCFQLSELKARRRQLTEEFHQLVKNLPASESERSRIDAVFDGTSDFIASADKIVNAQPDTVLIYPLVLKDKVRLLWASKGGVFSSKVCQIGEAELAQTVTKYRELLQSHNSDIAEVKATGKKLYSCLVEPLKAELKQNPVKNLVFIPDRDINYIPLATLFDGEKYLIENYNVFSILNAGLTDVSDRLPPQTQNTAVLGLGLSNAVTTRDGVRFAALSNVPTELNTIIKENSNDGKGFYPGLQLLNQAFNLDALENNLKGRKILHVATHGVFDKDDPQASYIVLGNGDKYPISQIQFLQNLRSVHLVVLSACETGVGGRNQYGTEIPGISSYFLRDKAKAVIASLWLVNDKSTSILMQEFYKNLVGSKMTKASALRQAQLSLLSSRDPKASNAGDRGGILVGQEPGNSPSNQGRKSDFSHPYYWAPFILTGNGF